MVTYDMVKTAFELHGLVDITPDRRQHPETRHFLDPRVSDMFGDEGRGKMRVYYVFNPVTGIFRRRIERIWMSPHYGKMRHETAYALNRRKTVPYLNHKIREVIPVHDIVQQMQLAATAIDSYRIARKVQVD